ncbi:MAG TPA: nuclear transport factor 2 family protein [Puia sp.]|nr:nuclear transport factor 2 family protein [Puia sp.]
MRSAEQLIRDFYTCFQNRDWKGMQACYGDDAFFYDPVFQDLQGHEVKAMWEMLVKNARDLQIVFGDIRVDNDIGDGVYGSCNWAATYTFSQTGRRVVNKVKARFKFEDGKIAEHMDQFDLWKWSRQALGLPGILFGWTPPLQKKIRAMARKNLDKFLTSSGSAGNL